VELLVFNDLQDPRVGMPSALARAMSNSTHAIRAGHENLRNPN
jgi:hypothetical protein